MISFSLAGLINPLVSLQVITFYIRQPSIRRKRGQSSLEETGAKTDLERDTAIFVDLHQSLVDW